MNELVQFSDNVWTLYFPLRVFGMELGTRATILRLPSGRVAIISPVKMSDEVADAIEAIGPVDAVISPNLFHHLFFNRACERFPDARRLVPPGLKEKIDLIDGTLELTPEGAIEDTLHWRLIEGAPALNEHHFYFQTDRALVVTDLAFHFVDHPQRWLRVMMGLLDGYGRLGPSRLARTTFKDKKTMRTCTDAVLQWDFDGVVVAHGACIPDGGKPLYDEAFRRVLG